MKRIMVQLSDDAAEWLEEHAKREDRSLAAVLRQALIAYRKMLETKKGGSK
jgi:hypothetical protein